MTSFRQGESMRLLRWLSCVVMLLEVTLEVQRAQAQDDPALETGAKPFGTYHGGNIDSVDLLNLGLNVDIPLISYPQRGGKLKLDFVLHYHNSGAIGYNDCTPEGGCTSQGGSFDHGFDVIESSLPTMPIYGGSPDPSGTIVRNIDVRIALPTGAVHHFLPTLDAQTWESDDGSGFQARYASNPQGNNLASATLVGPDGVRYSNPVGNLALPYGTGFGSAGFDPGFREDTNGNQITLSQTAGWTDTMGRVIPLPIDAHADSSGCSGPLPIASASLWNPPGVN